MKLKQLEFKLNNVITQEIEIPLDKTKICLIGDNGSGKSTVLYAINKMFHRNNFYIPRYFVVEDYSNKYLVKLPKKFKEHFFYKDDFEVYVKSKGYTNEFYSPIFRYELDMNLEAIRNAYNDLIRCIENIKNDFDEYCVRNEIDSTNYGTAINYYLSGNYSYEKNFKDFKETIGEGVLTNRYGYNNIFEVYEAKELVRKLEGGYSRYQPELLATVFSKFSTTGKVKNDRHLTYYNNKHHSKLLNLNFKVRKYNDAITRLNTLFGSYSPIYNYFNKNVSKNILLLDHSDQPSSLRKVVDLSLKGIRKDVYQNIFSQYKKEINLNVLNFNLYENLTKLNAINSEYRSLVFEDFEDETEDFKNFQRDYIDNKEVYMNLLKNTIHDNDIIRDFYGSNNSYFDKFNFKPPLDFVLNHLEEHINTNYPNELTPGFKGVELDLEQNNLKMKVVIGETIDFDELSSGTIWTLKFNLIKSLISKNDILLIDEPALFLHLGAQKEILKQLIDLKCIVIYTTHTPYLIPLNLSKVKLYETKIEDNLFSLTELKSKIEDKLIDIFGLKNLSNVLVDYSRKVILHTNAIESFNNLCESNGVRNDIYPLSGDINSGIVDKLMEIFNNYKIEPIVVVKKKNSKIEGTCQKHKLNLFTASEIKQIMSNSDKKDLSQVLEEVI